MDATSEHPAGLDAQFSAGTCTKPFANEHVITKRQNFKIKGDELLSLAKDVVAHGVENGPLSVDFQFTAPFIGPLNRDEFRHNLKVLDLHQAFPDLNPQYYGFQVDLFEPNRVWYFLRPVATNLGHFQGKMPLKFKPTGRCCVEPPQVASLTFNSTGEVEGHTMGYVVDRTIGTTGGLGGAFGLMWNIGHPLPVPEGKPWSPSLQLMVFNTGNAIVQGLLMVLDRVTSFFVPSWLLSKHARNNV